MLAPTRTDYYHFQEIPTRWMDNDVYGHVNNVVYYSLFDTAVNQYLIERGVLDVHTGKQIGLVVETQCQYLSSITFPDKVVSGIRVTKIGNTSVRYEIGLFVNDSVTAAAHGYFVHVYVDRETRRPIPLSARLRAALIKIAVDSCKE